MKTITTLLLLMCIYIPGQQKSDISTFDIATFETSTFDSLDLIDPDAKENLTFETSNFEIQKAGFPIWLFTLLFLPFVFFYAKYTYLSLSIALYDRFRCTMKIHYLEQSFVDKCRYYCPYPHLKAKSHTFNMKIWKAEDLLNAFDDQDYSNWLKDENWQPKKLNMILNDPLLDS